MSYKRLIIYGRRQKGRKLGEFEDSVCPPFRISITLNIFFLCPVSGNDVVVNYKVVCEQTAVGNARRTLYRLLHQF